MSGRERGLGGANSVFPPHAAVGEWLLVRLSDLTPLIYFFLRSVGPQVCLFFFSNYEPYLEPAGERRWITLKGNVPLLLRKAQSVSSAFSVLSEMKYLTQSGEKFRVEASLVSCVYRGCLVKVLSVGTEK